mmetsp:Transcript_139945/g.198228  ORF Transcript_139945/g.198228 Transcript_139945/m.198228 type:complete len:210 (-) Transcript_139945:31-660(-)
MYIYTQSSLALNVSGGRKPHSRAGGAHGSVLEEHRHQSDHGQSSVGELGSKLGFLHIGILELDGIDIDDEVLAHAEEAVALVVTRGTLGVLAPEISLIVTDEEDDLQPTLQRHLRDGRNPVRHVGELEALLRREVAGPPEILGDDVTNAGQHADPSMFQLHSPSSLEGVHVAIGGKPQGVPKSDGGLHAKLSLEGSKGRVGIQRPVSPG